MPDKRQKGFMGTYISCDIVQVKTARVDANRNLWFQAKMRKGWGRGAQYYIVSPISFVKSCLHCGQFVSLFNCKLFNKVTMSVSV